MSVRTAALAFLFFIYPASSYASFADLEFLGREHRVSGEVWDCEEIVTYGAFGVGRLERTHEAGLCNGEPLWGFAQSQVDDFEVSTLAWGDGTATATATYVFRSLTDTMNLEVRAEALVGDPIVRGHYAFSLVDLGTGSGILSFETPYCGDHSGYFVDCLEQGSIFYDSRFSLSMNTETVYRLNLYSWSSGGGQTSSSSMLKVYVPEPGTFMLSLAGLLGLMAMGRARAVDSHSRLRGHCAGPMISTC
jgi:hypothetical protein